MSSKYVFGKTVEMKYEQALERVTQELAKEGFGILTEIDVAATLKKKLGEDIHPTKFLARAIRSLRTAPSRSNRRLGHCSHAMSWCAMIMPA